MLKQRDRATCAQTGNAESHFNTFQLYSKLMSQINYQHNNSNKYNYADVRNFTRARRADKSQQHIDIRTKSLLIVPINVNNTHWVLVVAFMQQKKIMYYDSFNQNGNSYMKTIQRYIGDEIRVNCKGVEDMKKWQLANVRVPQQRNNYDCGICVLMNVDLLLQNKPLTYNANDMTDYRVKVANDIIRGHL